MQLAYCDLSKAFDCVHHETLIGKLRHYGVTGRALDLLKSYLSNRVQRVDVNVRNKELEFVNSTVFLGITLDDRLQWGPHITKHSLTGFELLLVYYWFAKSKRGCVKLSEEFRDDDRSTTLNSKNMMLCAI
ncbi:hypothetical protein EVAR_24828_1 [Eumeta japonica]|uniref:Uncharacterized protein n=1 Tax=Eumeta variegata TaxID=151549 RepID=A0A4C1W1H3_EUMVA|nr:hypothetical protein EVAR_24828_1 [Eumeta japonica]